MVSRDAFRVLVSVHRLKGFDRLRKRSVVVYRRISLPIVVEGGFRLFVLFRWDMVCDIAVGAT